MSSDFCNSQIVRELEDSRNILIAGAGGGFDVFSGLPLFFHLRNKKKNIYLANYSFSNIRNEYRLTDCLIEVTAGERKTNGYFPEKYLADWFHSKGDSVPIYCFDRKPGCLPLYEAYQTLVRSLDIDTIILVDGGSDSLLRGDETNLGTPVEDMTSIAAVNMIREVEKKFLVSLGFGIEHTISHAQVLESVAELSRLDAFVGACALTKEMDEVALFREASDYVFSRMPTMKSIVVSSIISAIDGNFGNVHTTWKTMGTKMWITPLMTLLWSFRLDELAGRVMYLPQLKSTNTMNQVAWEIARFRIGCKKRKWSSIPI